MDEENWVSAISEAIKESRRREYIHDFVLKVQAHNMCSNPTAFCISQYGECILEQTLLSYCEQEKKDIDSVIERAFSDSKLFDKIFMTDSIIIYYKCLKRTPKLTSQEYRD